MNWSANFREGLALEIHENKTTAKITAYLYSNSPYWESQVLLILILLTQSVAQQFTEYAEEILVNV